MSCGSERMASDRFRIIGKVENSMIIRCRWAQGTLGDFGRVASRGMHDLNGESSVPQMV